MKILAAIGLAAGLALSVSSGPASAQGVSAFSLIWHSSVVSYCENRELTHDEATKTAIGFSGVWKTLRDCEANRAKRLAAEAAAKKK